MEIPWTYQGFKQSSYLQLAAINIINAKLRQKWSKKGEAPSPHSQVWICDRLGIREPGRWKNAIHFLGVTMGPPCYPSVLMLGTCQVVMDGYGCSTLVVTLGLWQAESCREAGEDAQRNAAEEWHAGSGGLRVKWLGVDPTLIKAMFPPGYGIDLGTS